jgi:hypothetical protein
MTILFRSISRPIREGLSQHERWRDVDRGITYCWERGRQIRERNPDLAERAEAGELVMLLWQGGVETKLKEGYRKTGNLWYLAMWLGLRGDDLQIDMESTYTKTCTLHHQTVHYSYSGK